MFARAGLAAWLGAFAVLMLQLQLATHLNLDHDTLLELDDSCEICLKLDASGKAPSLDNPGIAIFPMATTLPREDHASIVVRRERATTARAPPRT